MADASNIQPTPKTTELATTTTSQSNEELFISCINSSMSVQNEIMTGLGKVGGMLSKAVSSVNSMIEELSSLESQCISKGSTGEVSIPPSLQAQLERIGVSVPDTSMNAQQYQLLINSVTNIQNQLTTEASKNSTQLSNQLQRTNKITEFASNTISGRKSVTDFIDQNI
tara:strand:+ start:105 stop:611 length:507 start_codon:yes stop_codon:yes gene_type:complete